TFWYFLGFLYGEAAWLPVTVKGQAEACVFVGMWCGNPDGIVADLTDRLDKLWQTGFAIEFSPGRDALFLIRRLPLAGLLNVDDQDGSLLNFFVESHHLLSEGSLTGIHELFAREYSSSTPLPRDVEEE